LIALIEVEIGMAGYLLRCRRCRQPVLSKAKCCPHCAVVGPARNRKIRNAVLGSLAFAAFLGALIIGATSMGWQIP
jgi:hypothetical protein